MYLTTRMPSEPPLLERVEALPYGLQLLIFSYYPTIWLRQRADQRLVRVRMPPKQPRYSGYPRQVRLSLT